MDDQLKFIDSHYLKLMRIAENIKNNLPKIKNTPKIKNRLFHIIKFSDIQDSWSVEDLMGNNAKCLELLAGKLSYMIMKGDSPNVRPMLEKIVTGRIKTFKFRNKHGVVVNCGKGHFRIGTTSFILSERELNKIKEFFNL